MWHMLSRLHNVTKICKKTTQSKCNKITILIPKLQFSYDLKLKLTTNNPFLALPVLNHRPALCS